MISTLRLLNFNFNLLQTKKFKAMNFLFYSSFNLLEPYATLHMLQKKGRLPPSINELFLLSLSSTEKQKTKKVYSCQSELYLLLLYVGLDVRYVEFHEVQLCANVLWKTDSHSVRIKADLWYIN